MVHSTIGLAKGLDASTVEAIRAGRRPEGMTEAQSVTWQMATEVHRMGEAGDGSFAAALALFGRQGVLEIVTLCGYYSTLAMLLNTARFMPTEGPVWPVEVAA